MSIWYHYDVTASGDRKAIAKFFSLDETDIHYIDHFEFNFGQKNVPGLRLGKLVEQNSDLIFLIKQSVEGDTSWWIEKFDEDLQQHQYIRIESSRDYGGSPCRSTEYNKLILEEYKKENPELTAKHLAGLKGFEGFRWSSFFYNFEKTAAKLKRFEDYKEMITVMSKDDFDDHDDSPFPDKADYQ